MALTINTNIMALNTQNQLSKSSSMMATSMERLSSGLRINSAKDDAAGLAIADRFTTQINGLNQAIRNANDGISLAQTAEGAMSEMSNILQRMRELAVQSINDTNTASDRLALQSEVDQLYDELDRIATTTQFNGQNVLDGTLRVSTFQIGANAGQTLNVNLESVTTQTLNLNGFSALGELNSGRVTSAAALAADDVSINGFDFTTTAGATALTGTEAGDIADAINLNTAEHGVTATAYNTYTGGTASGITSGLTINGDTVGDSGTAQELVDNINRDVAGVTAILNTDGSVTLSNDTGDDIIVAGTLTGSGFANATYKGYLSLSSATGEPISVAVGENATASSADVNALGFNITTVDGDLTGGAVSATAVGDTDNITINGVNLGESASASAADKVAAINAIKDETNVEASATTQLTVEFAFPPAVAQDFITINGVDVYLDDNGETAGGTAFTELDQVVDAINTAGIQGIVASANEEGDLVLTSATGLDITVTDDDSAGYLGTGVDQTGATVAAIGTTATTVRGSITLSSTDGGEVRIGGSSTDLAKIGMTSQGGSEDVVGSGLSVTSAANAEVALNRIDDALEVLNNARSELGAVQNRFESTISNLSNVAQNLTAARGRIIDADFASETTALSKAQILQQAGTAMLAQANASQQNVLSLLG